jgi:hypothetical protein
MDSVFVSHPHTLVSGSLPVAIFYVSPWSAGFSEVSISSQSSWAVSLTQGEESLLLRSIIVLCGFYALYFPSSY